MHKLISGLLAALVAAGAVLLGGPQARAAGEGLSISYVEPSEGAVQILLSVPENVLIDPDEVSVAIAGTPAESSAQLAGTSTDIVRRTSILAIDTSNSMARRGRFDAAKAAAAQFLDTVPLDVYVGIVTFDSSVETALRPSLDRAAAKQVVDDLSLALQTRLNDGVIEAVDLAGSEGQRSILVLSDGRDTSATPVSDVVDAITDSEVRVDVVALDQGGDALTPLEAMSDAGSGSVIEADPEALEAAFAREASSLARQIQVTANIPDSVSVGEATIQVSVPSGAEVLTASTFSVIQEVTDAPPPLASQPRSIQISQTVLYGAMAAIGIGLMMLFVGLVAVSVPTSTQTMERRITAHSGGSGTAPGASDATSVSLTQAKDAAASVLHRNRGLESKIEARLEAAGSSFKPAEWLLLHGAIALLAGLVGMLFGGGDLLTAIVFLLVGALIPWLWLGFKRKRRVKAFNAAVADTLQLIAGGLSAGLSLAQALNTVVQEGNEPIAGEFKRALVEARLGVTLEDALDGISARMESIDFEWVVMAIRIQREVGGNLAELLTNVAATLRERDYLRRQVRTLSAEGRISAWILTGLPIAMLVYMFMLRRDYLMPVFSDPLGWIMMGAAVTLLAMGGFLMSRMVKVEV